MGDDLIRSGLTYSSFYVWEKALKLLAYSPTQETYILDKLCVQLKSYVVITYLIVFSTGQCPKCSRRDLVLGNGTTVFKFSFHKIFTAFLKL